MNEEELKKIKSGMGVLINNIYSAFIQLFIKLLILIKHIFIFISAD